MTCVEPNAPIEPCCMCGMPVHTCEREVSVNDSYLCPVHGHGGQFSDGRWTCSDYCYERAMLLMNDDYHIVSNNRLLALILLAFLLGALLPWILL